VSGPSRAQPTPQAGRFPPWLRKRVGSGGATQAVTAGLRGHGLHSVCEEARCPNLPECFAAGTATVLLMGDRCTRACRFCAVQPGPPPPLEEEEPTRVAAWCGGLGLSHLVLTSVTRDDLPDGGAEHIARTIAAVRRHLPGATVEVLVPDFQGQATAVARVLAAEPDVFGHNLETVPRLYPELRPGADYARSLAVLSQAAAGPVSTKTAVMLGLGETLAEVRQALRDLRTVGCRSIVLGQYLSPSREHYPVVRYPPPEEFDDLAQEARELGFAAVLAAPFARSSYRARSAGEPSIDRSADTG
jgi:lipoyl synthase